MQMDFHEKIKEQRKVKNITQVEIAAHLGIGQDLYSRYENGKIKIIYREEISEMNLFKNYMMIFLQRM